MKQLLLDISTPLIAVFFLTAVVLLYSLSKWLMRYLDSMKDRNDKDELS